MIYTKPVQRLARCGMNCTNPLRDQRHFTKPVQKLVRYGMIGLSILLWFPSAVKSATSRPNPALPSRAWKQEVSRACRIVPQQIIQTRPYHLQHAGKTVGLVLAKAWEKKSHKLSILYALTYRSSSKGWKPGQCIQLFKEHCSAKNKPYCEHQIRASQLIDLQAPNTSVTPTNGSWFGHTVLEPTKQARWPLLFIQSKTIRGTGNQQRSRTQTVMLSLRTQRPRPLMKILTMKRWPPILLIGRKQEPVGLRVQTLQFRYGPYQPIQLITVQLPIPSPFDKCCKPHKTFKRYQLSNQGFSQVHSL